MFWKSDFHFWNFYTVFNFLENFCKSGFEIHFIGVRNQEKSIYEKRCAREINSMKDRSREQDIHGSPLHPPEGVLMGIPTRSGLRSHGGSKYLKIRLPTFRE